MYLIAQHFIKFNIEGLANCNPEQDEVTYKNSGTISQQQKEINQFKVDVNGEIDVLKNKVIAFNKLIIKNKNNIAANKKAIIAGVKKVKDAAQAQQSKLNKIK